MHFHGPDSEIRIYLIKMTQKRNKPERIQGPDKDLHDQKVDQFLENESELPESSVTPRTDGQMDGRHRTNIEFRVYLHNSHLQGNK